VPVGKCETGRTVSVGGKAVGEMASSELSTLVDINGGHCYVRIGKMYALEGTTADPSKAPAPSEPIVYAAKKGQLVHHVKPVFSFNGGLAPAMMTEDTSAFQERTELVPAACDRVKQVVEAAKAARTL
jgi:hypothetical protein